MVRVFLIGLITGGVAIAAALLPRPAPPAPHPICVTPTLGPRQGMAHTPMVLWGAWDELVDSPWRHTGERMSLFSAGERVVRDLHGLHNSRWDGDAEFVVLIDGAGDTRYRYSLNGDRLVLANPCGVRQFSRAPTRRGE